MNNKKNVPHFSMYIKSVLYIYCFSEVEINIIYTLLLNDAYDNCILYSSVKSFFLKPTLDYFI